MFNLFLKEDPQLVSAISSAFNDLNGHSADIKAYENTVNQLVKLHALKKKRVDPNTLLTVTGNLAIGIAVIKHESVNAIVTKVWSFISKT